MRARADVRARPVSLIAVTILVGVIGAFALAAFAGARQTDSAYARYRAVSNEPEAVVLSCANGVFAPPVDMGAVRGLQGVESATVAAFAPANLTTSEGAPLLYAKPDMDSTVIGLRDPAGAAVMQPRIIEGRMATAANEVVVGYGSGGGPRPSIGDTVALEMISAAASDNVFDLDPQKDIVTIPMHVTGLAIGFGELAGDVPALYVSPSFVQKYESQVWMCDAGIVQLQGDFVGLTPFLAGLYGIERKAFALNLNVERIFVERSVHLTAIIMRLAAGLAALAGIMVLGQFLVRRTSLGAIDTPVLRAVGMTRAQIVWAAALPAIGVAVGGALIAVAGGIALSPLFPTGLARVTDPDVGMRVDAFAIGVCLTLIVLTTILSVVIPARRLASARTGPEGAVEYTGSVRHSALAARIARLPLPVSVGAGARLALEPGHGRSATPVRSAVIGLSIAVAAMVAAFGYSASMDHFGATPYLWGWDIQFAAGHPFIGDQFEKEAVPVVRADAGLQDLAVGNFQEPVKLTSPTAETQEIAWALTTVKGAQVHPSLLEGRWPTEDNEIALGADTLRSLGLSIGDTVTVTVGPRERELTIVGTPVFPDFGFGAGLGQGVGTTLEGLRYFYPTITENLVAGNFAPDADPASVIRGLNRAVLNRLDAGVKGSDPNRYGTTVSETLKARTLPLQLSILFAFTAFATLVHVLLTSVRRRKRDLAILQTLGFRRRQIAATVAWMSLILTGLALLIGVPIGMLLGRLGWSAFAYRLGVINEPVLSPYSILVIPITLVAALLVSLGPGLVARRVKPAAVLKAE
jgi:ABC-type antimicrobial peptide transport system permease subunit